MADERQLHVRHKQCRCGKEWDGPAFLPGTETMAGTCDGCAADDERIMARITGPRVTQNTQLPLPDLERPKRTQETWHDRID